MRAQELAKPAFERTATSHRRMARNKKDNIFSHESKHGVDVTGSGGAVPKRYQIANGLFVRSHGTRWAKPACGRLAVYGAGFGVGALWNCTINQRSPRFCMTAVFRDRPREDRSTDQDKERHQDDAAKHLDAPRVVDGHGKSGSKR